MMAFTSRPYRPRLGRKAKFVCSTEWPENVAFQVTKEPPWRLTGFYPIYKPQLESCHGRFMDDLWRRSVFEPFCEACQWLEAAKFSVFWDVFGEDGSCILEMLDSYLVDCPRMIDSKLYESANFGDSGKSSELHGQIHASVFRLWHRLSYHTELEPTRIEPNEVNSLPIIKYRQLMERFRVFDIPRIMDLCVLYGLKNENLIKSLIERVFAHCPWLSSELPLYANCMISCLKDIRCQCDALQLWITPKGLGRQRFDDKVLQRVVLYLLDYSYTIRSLINFAPKTIVALHTAGFLEELPHLYEHIMKVLIKEMHLRLHGGFLVIFKGQLGLIGTNFVSIFWVLINQMFFARIENIPQNEREWTSLKNDFSTLVESMLPCTRFLKALVELEPLVFHSIENFLVYGEDSSRKTEILQKIQAAVDFEPDVVDSDPKILISMYLANSKHLKSLLTKEKIKGSWEEMQRFKEPINQDLHLEMQHSMKIKANLNLFNQLGLLADMYSDVYEDEFDDSYDAYCPKRSHKEDELLEPQVDMLDLNVRKYRDYSVNFSGRNGNLERVQASKPKSPEPSLNLINFENSLSPTPKRDSRIELKRPEKTADLIYNTSPPTHIENVQLAKALEPKIFVTEDIGVGPSEVNRLIANDLISLKADAVSAVCSCVLPTIHSPTSLLTKNHSASIKSFFLEFGVSAESCTNAAQSVYDSSEICHN